MQKVNEQASHHMYIYISLGTGKNPSPEPLKKVVESFFIGCDTFLTCPMYNMRTRCNMSFINIHLKSIQSSNVKFMCVQSKKKKFSMFRPLCFKHIERGPLSPFFQMSPEIDTLSVFQPLCFKSIEKIPLSSISPTAKLMKH